MAVCSVLRCTARIAHVVSVAPPEVGMFGAAVCHEHKQAIDAGAQWTYDTADRRVYMGQDVAAPGHHVVRSTRLNHLEALMPDLSPTGKTALVALGLGQPHIRDLSTSTSQPGEDGSEPHTTARLDGRRLLQSALKMEAL
jgi:hypothetical protein